MAKATDVRTTGAALYFIPVRTRVPLKFGPETLTHVTCARACVEITDRKGRSAHGWGETPLSVQWVWPSAGCPFQERGQALQDFCVGLTELWADVRAWGHPLEMGHDFLETVLPGWLRGFNQRQRRGREPMPWLAALVCCSAFDLALHDAYGRLWDRPVYETYTSEFISRDLAHFVQAAQGTHVTFQGKFPADFLEPRRETLDAWHLVGGLDLLEEQERTGAEPDDGYPVLLKDWIVRDGLRCLKIKLRGNDLEWDYCRLVKVATIALATGVTWLSADFNCTVTETKYVTEILDRLRDEQARIYGMILYVEQPFPYELQQSPIDVRAVSARKPLFLDESAHDWRMVRLGRELGWSGVALKTCKTQTGALLAGCWAKAHGLPLMVQDLTNPMLAQIPHVLLAAHSGTIMGVETNAMQFYPEASVPEARVHPGIYARRAGRVVLTSISGPGFGYRLEEISRELPAPAAQFLP
jgi:L-alanine-DL-glutamate epimerase-like enolase superfamily enzyme